MTDDGGPAFPSDTPIEFYESGETKRRASGMTLRDWFAGQALAGILANSDFIRATKESGMSMSENAYAYADAMLKAREEQA